MQPGGTYQILLMYYANFAGLSAHFRVDIWQHGTLRRLSYSMLQALTDKVSGA
jgi:hypothetical protein